MTKTEQHHQNRMAFLRRANDAINPPNRTHVAESEWRAMHGAERIETIMSFTQNGILWQAAITNNWRAALQKFEQLHVR